MKVIIIGLVSFLATIRECHAQDDTQTKLTSEYGEAALHSKIKLDSVFNLVLKTYASDALFIKNIKVSQMAWIKYFYDEQKAMFPAYSKGHYGSMYSMCVSQFADKLIKLRIQDLETWLIGSEDGDCSSSIRSKDELPPYTP